MFLKPSYGDNTVLYREAGYEYAPIEPNNNPGTTLVLIGYFQSFKYFSHPSKLAVILKALHFPQMRTQLFHRFLNTLSISGPMNTLFEHAISIHFRCGDYAQLSNVYHILDETYYTEALNTLKRYVSPDHAWYIHCFVDKDDLPYAIRIMDKLKPLFPTWTFLHVASDLSDWEQLMLMTLCAHNIIANSTFSWWGAFLNPSPSKIIVYPEKWFANGTSTDDLCPPQWIKV